MVGDLLRIRGCRRVRGVKFEQVQDSLSKRVVFACAASSHLES